MIIDLTLSLKKDNDVYIWAKQQENPYIALGHVGTHLDTYKKTKIPLEYFESRGIVFNVKNKTEITLKDINIEQIKENDFILFYTGSIEKYGYGSKEYFENQPCLEHNLIHELIKRRIRFIGVDCAGIQKGSEHEKIDRLCEDNGIYVIENLVNLQNIHGEFCVYTLWFDDEIRTGLPCRVLIKQCE